MTGEAKKVVLFCCIVLILIVLLEFLCMELLLFDVLPHIGILFHLAGGIAVGIGVYYLFLMHLADLPWYLKVCFIVGFAGLAAIGWEGFEWILSIFYENNLQGSLNNTMEDLYVGVFGGCLAAGWVVCKSIEY